jgi:hypothetical protein
MTTDQRKAGTLIVVGLAVALAAAAVLTLAGCGSVNALTVDGGGGRGGAGGQAGQVARGGAGGELGGRDGQADTGTDAGLPFCPYLQGWNQCGSSWGCFTCTQLSPAQAVSKPCMFDLGDPDAGRQTQPDGGIVYCMPDCSTCPP